MTETFTIYTKGHILLSKGGGHIDQELDVISDTVAENGTRTIVVKPSDVTEFNAQLNKLVDIIAERLGESNSKHFKEILKDSLKSYHHSDVARMLKKVQEGKEPIKAHRGCYRIHIGDGRTRKSDFIKIRD